MAINITLAFSGIIQRVNKFLSPWQLCSYFGSHRIFFSSLAKHHRVHFPPSWLLQICTFTVKGLLPASQTFVRSCHLWRTAPYERTNQGRVIFSPRALALFFVLLPVVSRRRRPRTKLQLCAISSPQLSRALENRNLIFRWHETTLIPRVPSYCIVSSGWLTKLCHLNSISRLILRERFLAKKRQMSATLGFGPLLVCIHIFDWLEPEPQLACGIILNECIPFSTWLFFF